MAGSFCRSEPAAELRGLAKSRSPAAFCRSLSFEEIRLGHVDLAAHLADFRHVAALELLRHVLERPDIGGDVLALGAVAARGGGDEFAVLVAQRHRQAVDLRLGVEGDFFVVAQASGSGGCGRRNRPRPASANALSSESIGTACRTFLNLPVGAAPTLQRRRIQRAQIGKALLDRRCCAGAARRIRRR